ncbi:MAG: zinc-ribbon domain-containing protein [Haloarcula sp.]
MPEPDRTVRCPICDEAFDPAVAGGWCTNPDCGEWRHDGDVNRSETPIGDTDTSVPNDAALLEESTEEPSAPATSQTGELDSDTAGVETTESEPADVDNVPADVDTDRTDHKRETTASADDSEEPADETETILCPDCERELDAEANFCVECGADVREVSPSEPAALDACPECGVEIDDDDSFCANCGTDLDAHRSDTTPSTDSAAEPSSTDESSDDDTTTETAVEALASQSDDGTAIPDGLVLSVQGRDIDIEDGDRIGREIRAALIDAGRPENEAVRIHREHVRFDRKPDGYYLVDLGDNPTQLNGAPLKKGDREPVQPGDELELSGVATITIRGR